MSDTWVTYLISAGVPSAVGTAILAAWNAWRKSQALKRDAPDKAIDSSLSRMQQAAIVQDTLVDNLKDALEVANRRAHDAEQREAALIGRLSDMEAQLEQARQQLAEVTEKLKSAQEQFDAIRQQITPIVESETT